jgi:hypothetical protein
MHDIIGKWREKEIIGVIVQGFTCLIHVATAQTLQLQDLGSCRRMKCLNGDDQKQANKKLRNSTPDMV